MRKGLLSLMLLCCCLCWAGTALGAPPRRIVSLSPAMTEILFGLGVGERVVGVTSFCDRPPRARQKPRVGGMANPSLEAVIALKPDLVVMSEDGNPEETAKRLKKLGVAIHVFRAKRLRGIPRGIRELGRSVGAVEGADRLAGELERAMGSGAPRTGTTAGRGKKALFVIWPEPLMVAGPGTLIDDALTLAGFKNIAGDAGVPYPRFSVEEVLLRSPDAIFMGTGHDTMGSLRVRLLNRLARLPAVREGHVFSVGDALYRPGPRVPSGIAELTRALAMLGRGGRP